VLAGRVGALGRIGASLACGAAAVAAAIALVFPASARIDSTVRLQSGPTRLLVPSFGYTVAYRTVDRAQRVTTTIGVFVYDRGRWRNVTPPGLRADTIDDVAFLDPQHGWIAAYDCANVNVYLYRTSDGGRTWHALGAPADHSCGGGPTWLSFIDPKHGWMEPVSPNGPQGELLRTSDGGRTWIRVAGLEDGLPCLAPIAFVSRSVGWMGRCDGHVYSTSDGGRRWRRVTIHVPRPPNLQLFDLPRFFDGEGVEAATLGQGVVATPTDLHERAVAFSVSVDGGRSWSLRAVRPIAPCLQAGGVFYPNSWPAGIAGAGVWWIVVTGRQPSVQRTSDAGHTWQTVVPRGLPSRPCAVVSVSAASSRVAWVVAQAGTRDSALFQTRDGGRAWRRVTLLP
jgi:hypothetical protein